MKEAVAQQPARRSKPWYDSAPSWLASFLVHAGLLLILAMIGWTIARPEDPPVVIELGDGNSAEGGQVGDSGAPGGGDIGENATESDVSDATDTAAAAAVPLPQTESESPTELLPGEQVTQIGEEAGLGDPALAVLDDLIASGSGGGEGGGAGVGKGLLEGAGAGFAKTVGGMRVQGLDIVLVFDATDSMAPYIEQTKTRLRQVVAVITGLVDVDDQGRRKRNTRFGVVAYKDYGDDYGLDATESLALTDDAEKVRAFIDTVTAGGGGDEPEPIHEALRVAGDDAMGWKRGRKAVIILIGDAPVHRNGRKEAYASAERFARQYKGVVNAVDVGGAKSGGQARGTVLEDFAKIARAGAGQAFLLKDEGAFWRSLIISAFGPQFAQDVEMIVEKFGDVD